MNKVENNKINQKAPLGVEEANGKIQEAQGQEVHFLSLFPPQYEPGKVQTLTRCGQEVAPACSQ